MTNKTRLQNIFIFGILAILLTLIIFMLRPFATVILWTILLYILIRPFHQKAIKKLKQTKHLRIKKHFLAGSFAIGTLLLIIIPLILLIVLLTNQCLDFLKMLENYITSHPDIFNSELFLNLTSFLEKFGIKLQSFDASQITSTLVQMIQSYSSKIFDIGKTILSTTSTFFLNLVFIVFALYFCFLDGAYLANLLKKAIPIDPNYMKVLSHKFSDIIKNLFSGYILVALFQGIMAFIIMLIFKVPGALLFSFILMITTFVPIFGAAIVWLPIGIVICFTQSLVKGIAFLIISAICISFLDNFLRPLFLKDRINVHPLVIFFAILGGVKFFGLNGLILGPLVVILFFTVLDLIITNKSDSNTDIVL